MDRMDGKTTIQIQRNQNLESKIVMRRKKRRKNPEKPTVGGTSAMVAMKNQTTPLWSKKAINE